MLTIAPLGLILVLSTTRLLVRLTVLTPTLLLLLLLLLLLRPPRTSLTLSYHPVPILLHDHDSCPTPHSCESCPTTILFSLAILYCSDSNVNLVNRRRGQCVDRQLFIMVYMCYRTVTVKVCKCNYADLKILTGLKILLKKYF